MFEAFDKNYGEQYYSEAVVWSGETFGDAHRVLHNSEYVWFSMRQFGKTYAYVFRPTDSYPLDLTNVAKVWELIPTYPFYPNCPTIVE